MVGILSQCVCVYISQIAMLYTLNILQSYLFICQLYPNKAGREKKENDKCNAGTMQRTLDTPTR